MSKGRQSQHDIKLLKKLAKKLGKDEKKTYSSVSTWASKNNVSVAIALIILAEQNGIGTATARNNLAPNAKVELDRAKNNINNITNNVAATTKNSTTKIKSSQIKQADFYDPHLPANLYNNCPTQAYEIMFLLENSIRLFIERVLCQNYGEAWWTKLKSKKATNEIVKKVIKRKKEEKKILYHSKRGSHEIYYTDYLDLKKIMNSCEKDFKDYLSKEIKLLTDNLFIVIANTRNIVAHNNPISKDDFDRLKLHAKDWFKYMCSLKKK